MSHPMIRRRAAVAIGALLALSGVSLTVHRLRAPAPQQALSPESPRSAQQPPTGAREAHLAAFDSSLRAIEDGDQRAPRDRWDPAYVAGVVGSDPADLFAWVQDSTSWVPYRGQLRGPVGVLLDRQGNSLDRALLLAALLEAGGHSVRLAHGPMHTDSVPNVLADLVEIRLPQKAAMAQPGAASAPRAREISARYDLDGAAIERSLEVQDEAATRFYAELQTRVTEQSARLLQQVAVPDARADWAARFDSAAAALRDHWWVQRQEHDRWVDMDLLRPTLDGSATTLAIATETFPASEAPLAMRHRLTVRLIAEQWAAGSLSEHRILEHALQPSELHGVPIVLQIWPGEWPRLIHSDPTAKHGLRAVALAQREWSAVLVVGRDAPAQATLADDGTLQEPTGGGPFGGLGAGVAGAAGPRSSPAVSPRTHEMTAAWIEYELHAPGTPSRIIRRAVFDLLGPAARSAGPPAQLALTDRQRLIRSLALMIRTEILPVTSGMAPEYVSHLTAQAITANAPLLRAIVAAERSRVPEPDSLLVHTAPSVSTLYSLAAARFTWSPVGDRIHVDRLGLLTRHRHPAVAGDGFGLRGAVDVAAGDVGVSLVEPDAFQVRLQQGVLDTNAEALWWDGATVLNAGEAYQAAGRWTRLSPGRQHDVGGLQLSADARTRIAEDLADGFVVIAPSAPIASGLEHFTGWWRIDPASGAARGVAGNGWGQCQEYATLVLTSVARGILTGVFEYGLCQGLAQAYNAVLAEAASLQARGIWFNWVGAVQFSDAKTVFAENNKACLIGAIAAGGLMATLPIILKLRQLHKLKATGAAAPVERPPRFQRARSGRPPPRPEPPPRQPPFVVEKEVAHRQSQMELRKAMQAYSKGREAKMPQSMLDYMLENIRAKSKASAEAFDELLQARREAEELARSPRNVGGSSPMPPGNNNKTITDLNVEFATELIQVGFGGLIR